ncbi:low-specificity L-threonine aldolase [candidate division KSB3 bacterium]|uniref:Low-specificity L-threonine aldolase n=1 Tax=candidate division KSB3 bacterium TaxID=2044937 RepID=A0A2G6E936_9BACT|nr:MAG: low-specificity L-threonine aldolase [candidate division KSB3 bacterium]PIE30672.1 MAG: low-specificity L-threonine aldolase [candidate division KSB3 bacterium]
MDLRSDTVTRPTAAMRKAMAAAEVGDDVYGEDPTVNRLEELAAEMLGTEAAIFSSSGTQSNLIGIMSHCERGDEYIVGQEGHSYKFEGGGAAILGSIQPQPLDFEDDGTLKLDKVKQAIKPDNVHFARTKLLCLENTQGGKVLPLAYLARAAEFAKTHRLGLHLDGARIFNAAVKLNVDVREISRHADSISVCLSKGLGAPVGSLLCGPGELLVKARRWRKVLGGGMRQAGVLAAAGIIALIEHVERLADDHANAQFLADELSQLEELTLDPGSAQTNMVLMSLKEHAHEELAAYLKTQGILILPRHPIRLVTHLDVTREDIRTVVAAVKAFFTVGT